MTNHDKAVIELSVYNALDMSGQDMSVESTVKFLRRNWSESQSPNAKRVSPLTVLWAARRLEATGLIRVEGDRLVIPDRLPNGSARIKARLDPVDRTSLRIGG
ncbi:MAG: hypothetical protein ACYTBJ_25915 [Planctomycetota bacterium]|jgi:hypothetical protein